MQHVKKTIYLIIFTLGILSFYIYLNFIFDFFNTSGKGYDRLDRELTRLEQKAERIQSELNALNEMDENFKKIETKINPIINQINLSK